jgi:hypothetical protein
MLYFDIFGRVIYLRILPMNNSTSQNFDVRDRVLASATRLGVQLNELELERWLQSINENTGDDDLVADKETGIFGHKVTMLDFDPQDVARFRAIGKIVEFEDIPGLMETALSIAGSAAQSRMQAYPGDCDFFERVNIIAPTRAECCQIFARELRKKALDFLSGSNYQLIQLKFGCYPRNVMRGSKLHRAGSPIVWQPDEIVAGQIAAADERGNLVMITWDAVAQNPGWCILNWVVADAVRGQLTNASNVLDVTWEAPDGAIIPLDGYLDAYYQEIYLQPESAAVVSKLMKHASPDHLETYIARLQAEVSKYTQAGYANYGKVAKRLYNIFRLDGHYEEAAFLRELFDEPAAMLYQVHALIETIQDARDRATIFDLESILDQTEQMILRVIAALSGEEELLVVKPILRLYRSLCRQAPDQPLGEEVEVARDEVMKIVNNFFYEKMNGIPTIKTYIDNVHLADVPTIR